MVEQDRKTGGMFRLIPQQCRVGGEETEARRDGWEETGTRARLKRRADRGSVSSQLHSPQMGEEFRPLDL